MTTEQILTRVLSARSELNAASYRQAGDELSALADLLKTDLRSQSARKGGTGNAHRVIESLLTAVRKDQPYRNALHYAWFDSEGRQCVVDTFRAFRLSPGHTLPLEERPESAGDPMDLSKVYPPADFPPAPLALPLPTVAELRAFVKSERAAFRSAGFKNRVPLWDFGPCAPTVNAQYLLDLMTVLPDATEILWTPFGQAQQVLYARSEAGDALLLRVRVADKENQLAAFGRSYEAAASVLLEYDQKLSEDPDHALNEQALFELVSLCFPEQRAPVVPD